jgi:hypothetical protein
MEMKKDNYLPFIDVLISCLSDGSLTKCIEKRRIQIDTSMPILTIIQLKNLQP